MRENRSKVLVTGANGFIGRELCRQLSAAGHSLIRLTRKPATSPGKEPFGTPDFCGDIRDRDLLIRAMEGVGVVFHLAGIAHVDNLDQAELRSVSVAGTSAVAAAAVTAGVERVVFFSSSLAAAAELSAPEATVYGQAKYLAEQCLLEAAATGKLKVAILRPVNVYGPGMKGNIAALIRLIRRHRLPPLPKLKTRYSLVGLEDLCRAAILAADSECCDNPTWTVTDGLDYGLNQIEAAIYQALGRPLPGWHCPRPVFLAAALAAGVSNRLPGVRGSFGLRTYRNLTRDSVFNNSAICEALDFRPRQTFYTALPGLINVK